MCVEASEQWGYNSTRELMITCIHSPVYVYLRSAPQLQAHFGKNPLQHIRTHQFLCVVLSRPISCSMQILLISQLASVCSGCICDDALSSPLSHIGPLPIIWLTQTHTHIRREEIDFGPETSKPAPHFIHSTKRLFNSAASGAIYLAHVGHKKEKWLHLLWVFLFSTMLTLYTKLIAWY